MRAPRLALAPALILATVIAAPSPAEAPQEPARPGFEEHVKVDLLILDVQVLDRQGHPVPGLGQDDFDVWIDGGRPVPIASFDAACSEETAQKPVVVLAFDYQHLEGMQRTEAILSARRGLERGGFGDLETMVVALTGGLRIEQPVSTERDRTFATLQHMRDDVTLFAANFAHRNDDGFVRGLTSLFDVVGAIPKPKAILLFSAQKDVPYDEDYRNLAALAAASRSVVYPVDVRGLDIDGSITERQSSNDSPDRLIGVRTAADETERAKTIEVQSIARMKAATSSPGCG